MSANILAAQAFDMHPWPAATIDLKGCLTFTNAAFRRWLSSAHGDHIDNALRSYSQLLIDVRVAFTGQSPPPVRIVNEKDHVTYKVSLKPLLSPSGEQSAVVLYAEPAQSNADRERAQRIAVLDNALNQIFSLAYRCDDPKETLDRMAQAVVASGVADSAVIYVHHNDRWSIRHATGLLEDLVGCEVTERQVRPSLQALREDRVVVINDVSSTDEDTKKWLSQLGVCALMDVKIDVPWGDLVDVAIHYHSPDERRFTADDEIFLERVAAGITLALRNEGLIGELRKEIFEESRIQEELRLSQGQLNTILENIPVGIFVLNAKLELVRANARFEELFQVDVEKAYGKTIDRIIPSPLGRLMHKHCRQVLKSEKTLHFEEALQLEGGLCRNLATSKTALRDDQGRPYAVVAIATDITERKRLEEEIRRSNTSLERRVAERTEN